MLVIFDDEQLAFHWTSLSLNFVQIKQVFKTTSQKCSCLDLKIFRLRTFFFFVGLTLLVSVFVFFLLQLFSCALHFNACIQL